MCSCFLSCARSGIRKLVHFDGLFEHGLAVNGLDTSAAGIRLARRQAEEQLYGADPLVRSWQQVARSARESCDATKGTLQSG